MLKDKIKELGKHEDNNKKKVENIIFLIIILIVMIIIINVILDDDSTSSADDENETSSYVDLASDVESEYDLYYSDLEKKLENILGTIKGVGEVNVFINYSESSSIVAMYDEKTTTSSTEETDSSGGIRNTTSTETEKEVIYTEEDGNQVPATEKVIMPTIEGAIITATGASDSMIKTNIISAVEAATGLSVDKIQVFEMQ